MKPHHIFADMNEIDQAALSQFYDALKQPWAVAGALMPDVHKGYTLPIGSVVATEGVVVPAFVGYDIGCGMCAVRTSMSLEHLRANRNELHTAILRAVPVGAQKHKRPIGWGKCDLPHTPLAEKVWFARNGAKQFGTLGGGNHFIELGYDEDDRVWVVIHSGSRGFGHGLATEYMKLASGSDKAKEGHYPLSLDSQLGQDYMKDMAYATEYALDNRIAMLNLIDSAITGGTILVDTLINRNHNHAVDSGGMIVHRKGATHAELGMMGVIPGNWRDGSFIVKGKGNPHSLYSSSHGAGRAMSRAKAKKTICVDTEKAAMEAAGITAFVDSKTIDEGKAAYKDVFKVMELQKDLVEVVHHIKPVANVKG